MWKQISIMWEKIKYAMGWYPKFETYAGLLGYIKHKDINSLCRYVRTMFDHVLSHDYKDPYKEVSECMETYTADCYGKMWLVKLALDIWGVDNKRISLKSQYGLGHSILYFHYGRDFGIISNGNIYLGYDISNDNFDYKVIQLMNKATSKIYNKVKVYW